MGRYTGPSLRQIMKQFALVQNLLEMAAKKTCPTCGHGMSGFHYWYKGAWKCKSSSLANPNIAAASTPTQVAAPTPAAQVVTSPVATAPTVQTTAAAPAVDLTTPIGGVVPVDMNAIKYFLNTNYIMNYTIEKDGTVNVAGDVSLNSIGSKFPHLPVKFGEVKGNFTTNDVAFKSFKGFPTKVGGNVIVKQRITVDDYTGFPSFIGGMALIKPIQAKSLQGFSKYIAKRAEITISGSKHDLGHVGEFGGSLYLNVEDAPLPNLNGLQETIHGSFEAKANGVSSLEGFPESVKGGVTLVMRTDGAATPTKNMHKHIKKMDGVLALILVDQIGQVDKSAFPPLLSVVLVKGCSEFTFGDTTYSKSLMTAQQRDFERQINDAIFNKQDIHELQEQLIDSGFGKAARV